nr:uncharacterized protein LOC115259393 [Aedes albopictus]
MLYILLTLILPFFVSIIKANQVYPTCANEWSDPDDDYKQRMLCRAYRFDYDGYKSNSMYDFMDCTFIKMGWMNKDSRAWNVQKLAADMHAAGFPDRKAELIEIEGWCKLEFRNKLCAISYHRCLESSRKGIREFKEMIRKRETEFFGKNQCQGIQL